MLLLFYYYSIKYKQIYNNFKTFLHNFKTNIKDNYEFIILISGYH